MSNRKRVLALMLAGVAAAPAAAQECPEGSPPGTVIRGTVLDTETRVPLQEAEVEASWGGRTHRLETDRQGRFRFCRLPADELVQLKAAFFETGPVQLVRVPADDSVQVTLEVEAPHSVLRGRLQDAEGGSALASAEVRLLDTGLHAVTDASGEFVLSKVPPGTYRVQFELLGYGERTDSVEVDYRSTVDVSAQLARAPIRLAPLEVTVESHVLADVGFYQRRTTGAGVFMTREEWESRSPHKPSDVLRTVPGVRVTRGRTGFDNVVVDRRNCAVRYVMDGVRVNATFQIDEIAVWDIEALEIYRGPSEVPAEFTFFSTDQRANCGVIVIWTRRGGR